MKLKFIGLLTAVMIAALWLYGEPGPTESKSPRDGLLREGSAAMIPWELPKARPAGMRSGSGLLNAQDLEGLAQDFLNDHRADWEIRDYHELRATSSSGPTGGRVTYTVYQDGMPIVGATIEIEFDREGRVLEVRNGYRPVARFEMPEPEEMMTPKEVISKMSERFIATDENIATASKVLFAPGDGGEAELAYVIQIKDSVNSRPSKALFRASDGQLLRKSFGRSEF